MAAVTARTRCGLVKFRECGELLYSRIFPLRLKGAVYESYVRPVILYGSEAWCLKESEMGILQRTEISMMRAMCEVQLKDIKRSTDLMFMLGLNEVMNQLAMASSVCWYDHVLRRENGHVLRMALDFEVEGQRKKGRLKRMWKRRLRKNACFAKMHFADQSVVLVFIRLPLACGEFCHPQLLSKQHWLISLSGQ